MNRRAVVLTLVGGAFFGTATVALVFDRFAGFSSVARIYATHVANPTETKAVDKQQTAAPVPKPKRKRKLVRKWVRLLSSCSIVFNIHIPKTAGSSVRKALEVSQDYVDIDRANTFRHHGRNIPKTWPAVQKRIGKSSRPVLVSVEVGIDDLIEHDYPWFNQTCFFAVAREPHEWVLSAENHIKETSDAKDPMNSQIGFFSRTNIQSKMVGRTLSAEDRHKLGLKLCVFSVDKVGIALKSVIGSRHVGRDNARPHDTSPRPDVKKFVHRRYKKDLQLWSDLNDNGGVLCVSDMLF
eukprot:TRINITY_DN52717_c0_g1_i1.p1 TRINITY_DN52717_c0_g1~~TRINITY_DN52717_c0_g1_i1.p1  ORF type:complete len:295 (+),score=31.59 TRINITY_DN52717_c0_g1_i1:107-991(+)